MIRLMLALSACLIALPAMAAPFVVSDPVSPGVTHCGLYLDAAPKVEVPVSTDAAGAKICKFDLSAVSIGAHSIKATAIIHDPLWPLQESVQSPPLAFSRPAIPLLPAGLRLVP